jgi:hypothetical protein
MQAQEMVCIFPNGSRVKKDFPCVLNLILAAERNGSQFSLSTFPLVPVHEHDGIEGWPRTYKQSQFARSKRLIFKFASLPPTFSQNAYCHDKIFINSLIPKLNNYVMQSEWAGFIGGGLLRIQMGALC